jgi:hypothetical protein
MAEMKAWATCGEQTKDPGRQVPDGRRRKGGFSLEQAKPLAFSPLCVLHHPWGKSKEVGKKSRWRLPILQPLQDQLQVLRPIDTETLVVGEDDGDGYAGLKKAQLLQFFNLFQGAGGKTGEGPEGRQAVGINANMQQIVGIGLGVVADIGIFEREKYRARPLAERTTFTRSGFSACAASMTRARVVTWISRLAKGWTSCRSISGSSAGSSPWILTTTAASSRPRIRAASMIRSEPLG